MPSTSISEFFLESTMAFTFIFFAFRSMAVLNPSSLFVKTIMFLPGQTDHLFKYALKDPASIMPGLSLLPKAIDLSVAPEQRIEYFVYIFHKICLGFLFPCL